MKFAVNLHTCENYGQCTFVAPDQFTLTDDSELSFRTVAQDEYTSAELGANELDGAEQAASACPMQAIRILA